MASIQRRGPSWRAVIRRTGHPVQIKTWPTKAAAEAWARKLETEMDQASFVDVRSYRGTGAALLQRYHDEISPTKKGRTAEQIRLKALMRERWLSKPVNAINRMDVIKWREARGVSTATIRREMVLLSSVFNHAKKEWGLPVTNPLHGVSRPADSQSRDRRPSTTELGAIRSHFSKKKMGLIVELAIETAMRLSEICSLKWANVYMSERYVHLIDTKNGTQRKVPLSSRAVALLSSELITARILGETSVVNIRPQTVSVYWREAMKKLGIKDLHFHDLRHEATTRLAAKLTNVLELAAVTGHKDLKMLQRYYNPNPTDLAHKLG